MAFKTAENTKRIQDSILAPLERRVLSFLVERLPGWVNPDYLTILGFSSMIAAGLSYYFAGSEPGALHLVNFFLVTNWFGDSLDGTLARHTRKLRPRYGYYVDHITDAFGSMFLVGGLAFSTLMSERVGFLLLTVYMLQSINSFLAASALGEFRISFWKFSPTELRLVLIAGNLVALGKTTVWLGGAEYLFFDVGGVVGSLVIAVVVIQSAIANTRRLYALERV